MIWLRLVVATEFMSHLNEQGSHVLTKLGKNHTESVADSIYIQTFDYRVFARLIAVSRDLSTPKYIACLSRLLSTLDFYTV